jgi:hypothetical protein
MEISPPDQYGNQTEVAELDLLAQIVCDRIASNLKLRMEGNGFHRSSYLFSQGMADIHRLRPILTPPSSLQTETENLNGQERLKQENVLKLLTQEIESLLHHRLILEQERQGRSASRLSW